MNFKSLINDICCDGRIKDGIFDIKNADHVFVLQEYLEKSGCDVNYVVDKTANLFEAGRFPERQAYNKDGILVTFPSKEYKDRAVNKGTHFAENPKKSDSNLFTTPPADIKAGDTTDSIYAPDTEKQADVSVDQELADKTVDTQKDTRTPSEKRVDSKGVESILIGQTPLVNYSVDEAKRYGFYSKGLKWYDTDGNLIGEQIFDEEINKSLIKSIIKENAEEIELAIVNALKGQGYPNKNIESVAKKVAVSIKPYVGDIENAQRVGREYADLSQFWKSYKATDNTPKTDVIINNFKSSVKYGPSQLMSGGKNESLATFMAAVEVNPTLESEIIQNVTGMLNNFVASTRTVQGGVEDLLKKKPTEIKSELELKVKQIVDDADKAHKELIVYLDAVFKQNVAFKHSFVREAMTGEHKFTNGSFAIANYILSVSKTGDTVYFNEIDDTVINSVANSTKVSVRFKSTSVKKKGVKTGEYNFWSVVGLIVKDYKEKYTKVNEILESQPVLTENIMDQVKLFLQNIWKFITEIYQKIIAYIQKGFTYVIDFFGVDLSNEDIFVNGVQGGNAINIDFSKILSDNTPMS
jgi:hypothetical protein